MENLLGSVSRQALDYIRLSGYLVRMKTEARLFKALADETRLHILALLLNGELCVCEIIAALDLPQSTISRHLAYLRNTGWVKGRRRGVWVYYRLDNKPDSLVEDLKPLLQKNLCVRPEYLESRHRLEQFQDCLRQQGC